MSRYWFLLVLIMLPGCSACKSNEGKPQNNENIEVNNEGIKEDTEDFTHYFFVESRFYESDHFFMAGHAYNLISFYASSDTKEDEYRRIMGVGLFAEKIKAEELANLPDSLNLRNLRIYGEIRDLSFLENISQLRYLSLILTENKAEDLDLEPLKKFVYLEYLCLGNWDDISSLGNVTQLKYLHIIKDKTPSPDFFAPLQYLANLEYLELHLYSGLDILPIGDLVNLKGIAVYYNADLEPLNINPIGKLVNLERFYLVSRFSNYSGLDIFTYLSKLEYLYISTDSHDEIDLTSIGNLPLLKTLIIYSNINNVSSLNNGKLEALFISPYSIGGIIEPRFDLNWLSNLTNLRVLYIEGSSYIDDVRPLLKLPNIESIKFQNITNVEIYLPLLDSNSISSIYMQDRHFFGGLSLEIFREHGINIWVDE